MKLVADANVFFSAFLRDGLTRRIWLDAPIKLHAPQFMLDEFRKHAPTLLQKSGLRPEEVGEVFKKLVSRLRLSADDELAAYIPASEKLTVDPKDEKYVACALEVGADLWSRDRHLRQPRIKCWSTEELARHFGYL